MKKAELPQSVLSKSQDMHGKGEKDSQIASAANY